MKLLDKIRHFMNIRRKSVLQGRFEKTNQIRTSCSLDFLNEIRGQKSDSLGSQVAVNFNPGGIFNQSVGSLSPVTPPPRHRYISPERRAGVRNKGAGSTPPSNSGTPTPAKAVFILQKSESRESVHIDVSIVNDDGLCNTSTNEDEGGSNSNRNNTLASIGSQVMSTTTLPIIRSAEVCDDETHNQKIALDHFKFARTRSMRGPKGLRISKVYHQGREADTTAALTFSSEDEGKGNSDQSESPPPLPPRRHRSRPGTAMSSYRAGGGHQSTLDTNSISSEESFPSIPCLLATDLHRLRVTGDVVPPVVPPKSPLITRIEVTGEPVKPTVISTEGVDNSRHHVRSRSEVICGSEEAKIVAAKISAVRLPPVIKKNTRTKSSDNIIRKNRPQATKSESSDSVDEGIVLSTPTKARSHSAGRTRKLSEEIESYNVYNVRTGKITTSLQKPVSSTTSAVPSGATDTSTLTKRAERHQNCKKCIHATKS
ncbi:uncharacterized protein LOC111270554 isoform X2 [Varroa jacobsoni]|uniref:Uncharacterized protein n=1 Tax=Varroa destructor TaxID=109461 RepID=A0A7M7JKT7_VARDE|nr:uncharacterized protein LOC111247159 isoform X2 [Varroa destructor]XP_022706565.1 uncharacterized protein LOC111270554 isoform X2 [Varroa jacobsoni]